MSLASINPSNGKEFRSYEEYSDAEIDAFLNRAASAFELHRQTAFSDRSASMMKVADVLEGRKRELGELATREMGKPLTQAIAEVEKCAWVCRYYAEHAEAFLADERVESDAGKSFVAFQPLGPILAVMPWNFPFWQVFRFAAPALMAGNVALLKHASNVTGCGLAIEEVIREGGFQEDVFQTLILSSSRMDGILEDSRLKAATLTGSEGAGRSIGGAAGKEIKPSVLELGGSDAFIVLDDADLDEAAEVAVRARMQNNAQSCIAAKRFIVEEGVWKAFTDRFVERIGALRIGDPMEDTTDLGPLAREDLRDEVHDQVQRTIQEGGKLLAGGEKMDREGFYYVPAVIADVEPGMVPYREEIFGPVAAVSRARDLDHAVELANATPFGLGGAVFTEDRGKGEAVARRLDVGCAFVNEMVKSDPRLPFGGVKTSGYGRELSRYGIREFVNIKTVWVA